MQCNYAIQLYPKKKSRTSIFLTDMQYNTVVLEKGYTKRNESGPQSAARYVGPRDSVHYYKKWNKRPDLPAWHCYVLMLPVGYAFSVDILGNSHSVIVIFGTFYY